MADASLKPRLIGVLLVLTLAFGSVGQAQAPDSIQAAALHLLNRATFGPRPGDVDHVTALGVAQFIEQQLSPEHINDRAVERHLEHYEILGLSTSELAQINQLARRERRRRQLARRDDTAAARMRVDRDVDRMRGAPNNMQNARRMRQLIGEFQQLAVVRATLSERQLYEVMVDFWTNHFNVFLGKGLERILMPSYIEETIRPHAFGRFEDLLIATAKSPAMLFYLDNAQSVTPGARPPQFDRMLAMRQRRGRQVPDSMIRRLEQRLPRGLNENYARELLELHTLGVDGGYTQDDVINVARILTGWSIARPNRGGQFTFNEWAHDRDPKVVLGVPFRAGRGMEEGLELLRMLAAHASTRQHVSAKLCARFVHDEPPPGCIDAAVSAWEQSDGQIREVIRAILLSPEFWAAEFRDSKVKTPLEFVVSAVRAVGGVPDSTMALARVVAHLGQPLYQQAPPTGYPETQESWVNAGALLQRFNVSMGLAAGRLPGASIDLDAVVAPTDDINRLADTINQTILGGMAAPSTVQVMREQAAAARNPVEARILAIGLAVGSPEFQRQ